MPPPSAPLAASPQECRVEVFKPEEISDEELARSQTIQKTVCSFSRTFTLTGRKKKEEVIDTPRPGGTVRPTPVPNPCGATRPAFHRTRRA